MSNSFEAHSSQEEITEQQRLEILEECMSQYGHEIKRVVYSYVKNESDTEDITQDVFVKVYENLNTFRGQSSLRSWIYSIAINKNKDHLRSLKNRQRIYKEKVVNLWQHKDEESPEKHSMKQEGSKQILSKVNELPLKYREVIILYYFEELALKEISEVLSIKLNTAKARLQRARKKLKPKLEQNGGDQLG